MHKIADNSKRPQDCLKPGAKGICAPPEDALLLKGSSQMGPKWARLSRLSEGQSPAVVKNRLKRLQSTHLNPLNGDDTFNSSPDELIKNGLAL
jgi:hypothetical protein